jgi:uncharacterized NAD(P)/FAD-binding protein YdhS
MSAVPPTPPLVGAIIGAGFSGTLLAIHLLERCGSRVRILLFERRPRFARGAAYSTTDPLHLLNVPAGRMSAFPDRPDDLLDWLRTQPHDACPSLAGGIDSGTFISRRLYGRYLQHLLGKALWGTEETSPLRLVTDEVAGIDEASHGYDLTLAVGKRLRVDFVVLAAGNFAPIPPPVADPAFYRSPLYRNDPWAEDTLAGLDPDAPVLLLGTGMTMIDMAVSLLERGHRGPVHALSRRGLLPRAHVPGLPPPVAPRRLPRTLSGLTGTVRQWLRDAERDGTDWRTVLDGLRPHLPDIWRGWSEEEKRRFLRHLRPWWDVHRHRLAPAVAARIEDMRRSGRLVVHAGRLTAYRLHRNHVSVLFDRRGAGADSLTAARVINCTGPASDIAKAGDRLFDGLLRSGMVAADPLGLGIAVGPDDRVVTADGSPAGRMWAVGPLTRGLHWEITAVPEIRVRAAALAGRIAQELLRLP